MNWPAQALPENGQLEIAFHGEVDEATSSLLIEQMERRVKDSPSEKRVMRVAIELVQNLHHHSSETYPEESRFLAVRTPKAWLLSTANPIDGNQAVALREKIDFLSGLDSDQLRHQHRKLLSTSDRSPHGGGGVGLVEIHRKSNGEVLLEFLPSPNHEHTSVLTVEIHVHEE